MVVYMGTIAELAADDCTPTSVMRRILVPSSASVTVAPTAGLASWVIGCAALSCTRPLHRSMGPAPTDPPPPPPPPPPPMSPLPASLPQAAIRNARPMAAATRIGRRIHG